jgi:hypothetical protein
MRFPGNVVKMKQKTGMLIVVLALAILISVPINAALTSPVLLPDPTMENRQEALFFFENISKIVTTEYNISDFPDISSKITRYDLLEINESDVRLLQQQVHAGNKIPIRFRGISYFLVVNKTPVGPPPGSDQLSYRGNLENIPDHDIRNYFMTLSFYNNNTTLSGIISETDGPFTIIAAITSPSSGTQLYYVYSSADEKPMGARLDNDVWVMLPSGKSKLEIDLSPEERAWYINQQLERENQTQNKSSKIPETKTPLWVGTVIVAVGICVIAGTCFRDV